MNTFQSANHGIKTMNREEKNDRYYRSLLRNVVLTILFTAMIPTVTVSLFILHEFRSSFEKKAHDHLELLVRKHKKNIDMFLEEKLMDIRLQASAARFEELSNEATLYRKFLDLQSAYGRSFVDLGVVNHLGQQIAYAGPHNLSGAEYADSDWFKKAMRSPFFVSDVFKGLRGSPHFIIAVRQQHNGKPWILRASVDFAEFNNLVENLRIGQTGFAFILNKSGKFQTSAAAGVNSEKLIDYLQSSGMLERPSAVFRSGNHEGKDVLYSITTLKDGEWVMVLQQDYNEVFAELRHTQKIAMLIILVGTLVIIATALLLSQRLIRRISLADEEKLAADQEKEMMSKQVIETGKLASIGELAAGIAHEINNPVAIMIEEAGWIQDLLNEEEFKQGENLEEFNRALNQIGIQGRRCKEITHKLLSFARKTDSRISEISINELLEEIVYLSSQRTKYGNIEIQTLLAEDLPPVFASETEMQQVFLNLVNNAIDAMEKTGGTIWLVSRKAGNEVIVEVKDNGPGIAGANLSRIFDPFYTTKPVGKGTGLGLSICYGIINKIGGDIEAHSVKGEGSTFTVRIPAGSNSDQKAAQKKLEDAKRHHPVLNQKI
jgi:two-component system NtrC family sensor kinase